MEDAGAFHFFVEISSFSVPASLGRKDMDDLMTSGMVALSQLMTIVALPWMSDIMAEVRLLDAYRINP